MLFKRLFLGVALLSISLFADTATYLQNLYSYLVSKNWTVYGEFYNYDFDKNGYDYNDWVYVSISDGKAYRLLGAIPTQNNPFGWLPLATKPVNLQKPDGYFLYINFPSDENRAFSWLYIDRVSKKVYKLQGADPTTHFFKYLDIDGDGKPDSLDRLNVSINGTKISFTQEINQNPNQPPTNIQMPTNWQCTSTYPYENFIIENSVKTSGEFETKNMGGFCAAIAKTTINPTSVYAKEQYNITLLEDGDRIQGYAEYWFPEGKVHYHFTSQKRGFVDCTAFFNVYPVPDVIAGNAYFNDFTSFDDKENLINQGNCPDWIFDEEEYEEDTIDSIGEVFTYSIIKSQNGITSTVAVYYNIRKK